MKRRKWTDAMHLAAVHLHGAGWNDPRIGEALGVSDQSVRGWRKKNGIGPASRRAAIDDGRILTMYEAGVSDREIARTLKVAQIFVRQWRNSRGLPPKYTARKPLTREERRTVCALLKKGYSCRQAADATGRSAKVAQKLRGCIKDKSNLRKAGHSVRSDRERIYALNAENLFARIRAAVGRSVPVDIADDAVNGIYLALIEGQLSADEIERKARKFVSETIGNYASKYGPASFDDGDLGSFLSDTLVDDRAEAAIEESAALLMDHLT